MAWSFWGSQSHFHHVTQKGDPLSLGHTGRSQRGARAGPDVKGEQRQSAGATQTSRGGGGSHPVRNMKRQFLKFSSLTFKKTL